MLVGHSLIRPDDLHPTHHALEQMSARSITVEEVARALDEPETTYLLTIPRRSYGSSRCH